MNDLEVSANALPDRNGTRMCVYQTAAIETGVFIELDINALVFVGRVVEEISSSSTFLSNMCCDEAVTEGDVIWAIG